MHQTKCKPTQRQTQIQKEQSHVIELQLRVLPAETDGYAYDMSLYCPSMDLF
jgi:hypothetical protein